MNHGIKWTSRMEYYSTTKYDIVEKYLTWKNAYVQY